MDRTDSTEHKSDSIGAESRKRAAIIALHRDKSLLPREKHRRIQQILREESPAESPTDQSSQPISSCDAHATETDTAQTTSMIIDAHDTAACPPSEPSFYKKGAGAVFGCEHVRRDVFLLAPCCNRWYVCRECHDDVEDHVMNRKAVAFQICMHCMQQTPVGGVCVSKQCSGRSLACYYCDICHCHRKETDLRFWHCDQCGLCRVAAPSAKYVHCERCNLCVPADESGLTALPHTCMLKPSETQTCPVCALGIHSSTKPVLTLPCGHPIHAACLQQMHTQGGTYRCPLCKRSTGDMAPIWAHVDNILLNTEMPEPECYWTAHIGCNDCQKHTPSALYHYHGLKCGNEACGSYNTYIVELFKTKSADNDETE